MRINNEIVKAAEAHVREHLSKNLDEKFTYHNLAHTVRVVKAAELLCEALDIDKQGRKILAVSAWFHDIGYTKQTDNHETEGASQAEKFLRGFNVDEEQISTIKSCILATRYPQKPQNLLQEILCDADMIHLGDKKFAEASLLLRKEWELTKTLHFSDAKWYETNISFLSGHHFHTSYCIENAESKKLKNIQRLTKQLRAISVNGENDQNHKTGPDEKSKRNVQKPERGVETLFRSASANHMRLSGMADNKAHILLSINSIIISILLSVLGKKLVDATYLIAPTILLLAISAVSIVFAVLTTKPKVSKGVFTKEEINRREVNLLFFGNFHQMDLHTFEWGIKELMYDKDYLYKSMTKDIYFLGKVLARKYKYLNLGYRVFMYGLLASMIAYGISFIVAAHLGHPVINR